MSYVIKLPDNSHNRRIMRIAHNPKLGVIVGEYHLGGEFNERRSR